MNANLLDKAYNGCGRCWGWDHIAIRVLNWGVRVQGICDYVSQYVMNANLLDKAYNGCGRCWGWENTTIVIISITNNYVISFTSYRSPLGLVYLERGCQGDRRNHSSVCPFLGIRTDMDGVCAEAGETVISIGLTRHCYPARDNGLFTTVITISWSRYLHFLITWLAAVYIVNSLVIVQVTYTPVHCDWL